MKILWLIKNIVRPDAPPDNMWVSLMHRCAVLESCAAIRRPRHFEHPIFSLHAPHTQTGAEVAYLEIAHKSRDNRIKGILPQVCQTVVFAQETR